MRSTAIRWNFREYRFRFTLQFLSLQSVPLGTVSIQGFSPQDREWARPFSFASLSGSVGVVQKSPEDYL